MQKKYSKQRKQLLDAGIKIESLDKLYKLGGDAVLLGNKIPF
jgi:tRNA1(Val) A37 N6-methylase TrmN6